MIILLTLYLIFPSICSGSLTPRIKHTYHDNPLPLDNYVVPDLNVAFVEENPTQDLSPSRKNIYASTEGPSEEKLVTNALPHRGLNASSRLKGKGNVILFKEKSIQLNEYPFQRKASLPVSTEDRIKVTPAKRLAVTEPDAPQPKRFASRKKQTSQEASRKLFNVYDWDFVRQFPREASDTTSDQISSTNDELEQFFEKIKFQKRDGFFYIPRKELNSVIKEYYSSRYLFYTKLPSRSIKAGILSDVTLNLSDQKLALDDNNKFKNLVGHLTSRFQTRVSSSTAAPEATNLLPKTTQKIIEYIHSVNKITIFLILIHLSIFYEHDEEVLNEEVIEKLISFLENLWKKIEEPDQTFLNKNPWAEINSLFFSPELKLDIKRTRKLIYLKRERYHMAWNFVEQWAKEHGKLLKWGDPRHPKSDRKPLFCSNNDEDDKKESINGYSPAPPIALND
ncbi:hypothetical protein PSTG_07580 [Puccinia striiformis f. sp. tritici PST-78]|uniref:Uncharacterized protein n=1 Tax=Puccinia striiformis f. sp. tritici PST-78 TaxID=1165861 RepID=A0A0L0VII7_9BASI|nr:hypothetical protein PSTG_07580 [Puccinia striiformis f. sp. tritici PST-78]